MVVFPDIDVLRCRYALASGLAFTRWRRLLASRRSISSSHSLCSHKLTDEIMECQKIAARTIKRNVAFPNARAGLRVISAGKPVDMKVWLLHVFVKRQGRWQLVTPQPAPLT